MYKRHTAICTADTQTHTNTPTALQMAHPLYALLTHTHTHPQLCKWHTAIWTADTHIHTHTHSFTNGTPWYALLTRAHISTAVQREHSDKYCWHTHTHTHYKANWRTLTGPTQFQTVPQTANIMQHSLQMKRGYINWSKCENSNREKQTETWHETAYLSTMDLFINSSLPTIHRL